VVCAGYLCVSCLLQVWCSLKVSYISVKSEGVGPTLPTQFYHSEKQRQKSDGLDYATTDNITRWLTTGQIQYPCMR